MELDYLEDPESFFSDPDETKYKCDENGDIIMRIVLNLKTIAEYEAFVEKYEMEDAFICASTLFDFASYIELGIGSLEELLVYAVAPEVWYICVPPTAENQS